MPQPSKDKGSVIAKLVDDLFDDETAKPILSLVAVENDKLVGHILYTKVIVIEAENSISAQILAPLAVLPDEQKKSLYASAQAAFNCGGCLIEDSFAS